MNQLSQENIHNGLREKAYNKINPADRYAPADFFVEPVGKGVNPDILGFPRLISI